MTKKVHIGLLWHSIKSANMGVNALAYSSVSLLSEACRRRRKDVEFTLFSTLCCNPQDCTLKVGSEFLNVKIEPFPIWEPWRRGPASWYYVTKVLIKGGPDVLYRPGRFDALMDISEGDSFSDIYGFARFWHHCFPKLLALRMGRPLFLLPQTIGPFKSSVSSRLAKYVLRKATRVWCRDALSANIAGSLAGRADICVYPDLAFALPYEKDNDHGGVCCRVGINVSALIWHGGYRQSNDFALTCDYQKLTCAQIDYFLSKGCEVHLIPHVFATGMAVEDDMLLSRRLQARYPAVVVPPAFVNPVQAKSYISGMDFMVGARMHACIAAYSSGVPVFPLAYSRKGTGLFVATLEHKWTGDMMMSDDQTLLRQTRDAFCARDVLKDQQCQKMVQMSGRLEEYIVEIGNALFGPQ